MVGRIDDDFGDVRLHCPVEDSVRFDDGHVLFLRELVDLVKLLLFDQETLLIESLILAILGLRIILVRIELAVILDTSV